MTNWFWNIFFDKTGLYCYNVHKGGAGMNGLKQKGKILYILQILQKHTDKEHPITINQLIALLAEENIKAERKSIYSDIALLRQLGYNVIMHRSKEVRYYLESKPFDPEELKIIADAIQTAPFLPRKKTNDLIKKLSTLTRLENAKKQEEPIFVPAKKRPHSETGYKKMSLIRNAITQNKQITFLYQTQPAEEDPVLYPSVSPFLLVYANSEFFLIAGERNPEDGLACFQVDYMSEIQHTKKDRDEVVTYTGDIDFSLQCYAEGIFEKNQNPKIPVILMIKKELLPIFIKRYPDLHIQKRTDKYLTIRIEEELTDSFFLFLLECGKALKILSPESLASKINHIVKNLTGAGNPDLL